MRNYIRADVKRILRNMSHLFSMLLLFAIYFFLLYVPNRTAQNTSVSLVVSACGFLDWVLLFVGLFEMIAVFSEDFKVKTMQIAIGLGVSRSKVVICKLLEAVVLLVLDCVAFVALTLIIGAALGVFIPMNVLKDVILLLLVNGLLACTTYISLTMIIMFVTHSMVLSIFTYCFVGIGMVNLLLSILPIFGYEWLENLNLSRITLSYMLGIVHTRLALGTIDFANLLGIFIYLFVGLFATCNLFAKRELDF